MTPPPLAVWLMESFRRGLRQEMARRYPWEYPPEWVVREDEDGALLSLHGVNGRSAEVWVEWCMGPVVGIGGPEDPEPEVRLSIAYDDDDENVRYWTGTPAELVRWLRDEE